MGESTPARARKQKFLPLREIILNSRPLVKRAIQFSCDGDLAISADDSVHVFVPEFPDFTKRRERAAEQLNVDGQENNAEDDDLSSDEEGDGKKRYNPETFRTQFSEGSKHMPVSYPPIDPRINKELFTAVGLPFPYEGAVNQENDELGDDDSDDSGTVNADSGEDSDAYRYDSDDTVEGNNRLGFNQPFGAGHAPITSVGSSMNHVVRIAWSPSGLGVNQRPILAILTGSGTVAMYGDHNMAANILQRANDNMIQRRQLNSWIVLWGLGERMIVPNQDTELAEYIRSFAWAQEIGPGQALLATINDAMEIAIISIQTVSVPDENKPKETLLMKTEPIERTVWLVREIVRFKAEGPHFPVDVMDPNFVPCGTSFGVNWGPWLHGPGYRTCVISHIDRNYIGFRKITVKSPWIRGELPEITVDKTDLTGRCVHLTTDSFVEFENGVWTKGKDSVCRGIISTGWHLHPFEVLLAGAKPPKPPSVKHSVKDCGTAYDEYRVENPITDLVIHPPDPLKPTETPLYTMIRMSATPSNADWFETNVPAPILPADDAFDGQLQWVRSIAQKLDVMVPVDMYLRRGGYTGDSDSDGEDDDDDDDAGLDDDFGGADETVDYGDGAGLSAYDSGVTGVPEIHPHRFRLHGLTLSPGGGCSAVLVSNHSTQHPERGGWHTVKSNVLFSYRPRVPKGWKGNASANSEEEESEDKLAIDPQMSSISAEEGGDDDVIETPKATMTTEGQLFEYLYGSGPEVPGVHYPIPVDPNSSLAQLFAAALEKQTCELCGAQVNQRKGDLSGCEKGHYFGRCATSGLAVQLPGVTRSCGSCGLRTIRPEVLLAKVPEEIREQVKKAIGDGVCGGCGGKFLN
ncbi:hypothetical protein QBC38DRAFT_479874 [Podospora fimiseda]|uniref:Transcription factor IIIC 90kDa subunit N-terminal domain-containing protein n=1 Tax=Podospora fimiseda TaxID=252190 RepID=A0AAN7BNR0_9PEZI|nr:hypothetical protein QBC38DRAFT_479874 [Podospora fimiseda]